MGFKVFLGAFIFSLSSFAQVFSNSQIQDLKSTILKSTQTLHTPEGNSLFAGSFDWHSDVHAHWALLSIARTTGDEKLDEKMQSILNIDRIKREYHFLNSSGWTSFEKPYGRAWFLLMLSELSQRPIGQDPEFQNIRRTMTLEVLKWLRSDPFPEAGSSFIGSHNSWLMALFLTKIASRDYSDLDNYFSQLIGKKMFPQLNKLDAAKLEDGDFIFLPSMRQLIVQETGYDRETLAIPSSKKYLCHYPGALQTSLWAHANECAKNDAKSCDLVQKKNAAFYARKDLWQTDFDCVSHWVPQFMWMTHWLSLGMP